MPPIDIDRLRAQTAGDLALQREVLGLFVDAIPEQLARLDRGDDAERRAIAHQIVGSARALGANDVAREAAAVEAGTGDLARLQSALGVALTYIQATLLR